MDKNIGARTLLVHTTAVIVLFLTNLVMFVRIAQLQNSVLEALRPFQRRSGLETGMEAPDFNLNDSNGDTISLSMYEGHRLLLAFTSVSCSACQEIFSDIGVFSEENSEIAVLVICRGSEEENRDLEIEQDFNIPVLSWSNEVAEAYSIPGTPYFYVVDKYGRIENSGFAGSIEQILEIVDNNRDV